MPRVTRPGPARWRARAPAATGYRRIVTAVLLFSLNPVVYRAVALDPVTLLASVNAVAALALLAASAARGHGRQLALAGSGLRPLLLLAVSFTANNVLFVTAIKQTTIANATMTHYLAPLLVVALAAPLLREPPRARYLTAMLIACAGVGVMVANSGLSLADAHFVGLLYGSASAVFFAFEIVQRKLLAPAAPANVIAAAYLSLSVVLLSPFVDYAALAGAAHSDIAILVGAGVVTTALAVYLFNSALRVVSAQQAAGISYLEPVGAVGWALVLTGEVPDRPGIAGGLLVLAGILLLVAPWARPEPAA